MPLSLLNHSALALFAQRTRIPTSARSIGFCAIWVCISSSSAAATGRILDQGQQITVPATANSSMSLLRELNVNEVNSFLVITVSKI
jgi:hypothetical protein